ncbi:MAG: hypothetical protein QOE29_1222, partial [Gaiellaceae bacterium]|nr:hypothetical protein [Gaiellaceae bacterium]
WALIVQAIVGTGLSTLLLWWSSSWRPRFVYSRASLRELRGMSAAVFGSNLLFYVNRNVDNILISRFLGPAALGLYSVAYNAMLVPLLRLVSPVQQVFFPAFARLERPGEVGALWVRVTRATSALTVPAFVGLAVVAPELVAVVLGSKWHGAARILQVLAVVGVLQGVAWHTRNVLMALGRAQTIFRYSVVSAVLTVTAFAIGVTQGVVAVAVAYAVVTIVLTPAYIRLATQATGLSLLRFARPLAGVFVAAALMGLALLGLRALLVDELAAAPRLVLLVLAGTALYVPLAAWLAPGLRDELRDLRARRRGAATPV